MDTNSHVVALVNNAPTDVAKGSVVALVVPLGGTKTVPIMTLVNNREKYEKFKWLNFKM